MAFNIKLFGATGREKAAILVAIVLFTALMARNHVFGPQLEDWRNLRERIDLQQELYTRYRAVHDSRDEVRAVFEKNKQTIEAIENRIFSGTDVHVTAAKLQKLVQQLAVDHRILIGRTHVEKPVSITGDLYVISLGMFGEARTMKDINGFLQSVEFHRDKFLFAPRLYVKRIQQTVNMEIQIFSVALVQPNA